MKKLTTLIFTALISFGSLAQGKLNIVIFSEDGEPFFAFVNGIKQNANAETNVRITDLTSESFHFRIVFANSNQEPITKNHYLPFGNEYTFKIKKTKNGIKLAPFGEVALAESTSKAPSYAYTTTETPAATTGNTNTGTTITTSETITTTSSNTPVVREPNSTNQNTNESVSINMNVNENGMNVNMNVNGSSNGTQINTASGINGTEIGNTSTGAATVTTSTTTTTTSTHSSTNSGITNANEQNSSVSNSINANSTERNNSCVYAIDDTEFNTIKASIEAKPFEDTKMSTAKQATKSNCLNTKQILEIAGLFMMDDDKLAYAKYAYDFCINKKDYFQLSSAFEFDGTTEEFNAWLDQK